MDDHFAHDDLGSPFMNETVEELTHSQQAICREAILTADDKSSSCPNNRSIMSGSASDRIDDVDTDAHMLLLQSYEEYQCMNLNSHFSSSTDKQHLPIIMSDHMPNNLEELVTETVTVNEKSHSEHREKVGDQQLALPDVNAKAVTFKPDFAKTDGESIIMEISQNFKKENKELSDIGAYKFSDYTNNCQMSVLSENTKCISKDVNEKNIYDGLDNSLQMSSDFSAVTGDPENSCNTSTGLDSFDNDSEVPQQNLLKEISEKTMFSENLGLIPTDAEQKIIAQRSKRSTKGVRTRKSFEKNFTMSEYTDTSVPLQGHKHVPGCYKCGACAKIFVKICKLHDHLQDHCLGGSYHYDHILRTAFPKYDTTCSYTQTFTPGDFPLPSDNTFKKPCIKIKAPKILVKMTDKDQPDLDVPKKRRGRPRKVDALPNDFKVTTSGDDNNLVAVNDKMEENLKKCNIPANLPDFESNNKLNGNKSPEPVIDKTSELVDKYLKEFEGDIATMIENEAELQKKKSRKRKMSTPRKVFLSSDPETEKSIQDFSKSEIKKENITNSNANLDMKIKCDFCPNMFQYTRGLIRHEEEKHADQMKYECDVCKQKFMREYNLERHKLCVHTAGKSRFFRERKGIYRQKGKPGRRPRDQSLEASKPCEVCGKVLPESKIDIHLRIHTGERPYICHVCGKGLISEKKLKRHLLIHSEAKTHTCEHCGQGFSMKYKLRTHMFIHTGHKPYLCSVCGAEFNNSTSLLHHHRTVHLGDKRFECNICGGKYGKKSQLEEHMFSHSTERTQTCRYCGKSFKHAKSLRRHEVTHISDKKFSCDQCDSKFSRKDNLDRHKMCHIEATLQCSFCKKKFCERQPLIEHEQFHINQRRFQCQICKDKFQDEAYFYKHMEMMHGVNQEMLPMINSLGWSSNKEMKSQKSHTMVSHNNIMLESVKLHSSLSDTDHLNIPVSSAIDTLNLSMSVAGILPTTTSSHEMSTNNFPSMQSSNQLQNHVMNHVFNTMQEHVGMNTNMTQNVLNQSTNPGFASGLIHEISDVRRTLNILNPAENSGMCMSHDQQRGAENILLNEQHRMMQEALSSSLNMQSSGYRLQHLY